MTLDFKTSRYIRLPLPTTPLALTWQDAHQLRLLSPFWAERLNFSTFPEFPQLPSAGCVCSFFRGHTTREDWHVAAHHLFSFKPLKQKCQVEHPSPCW